MPRTWRDAGEMQARCRRDAGEMHARCTRDAREMQAGFEKRRDAREMHARCGERRARLHLVVKGAHLEHVVEQPPLLPVRIVVVDAWRGFGLLLPLRLRPRVWGWAQGDRLRVGRVVTCLRGSSRAAVRPSCTAARASSPSIRCSAPQCLAVERRRPSAASGPWDGLRRAREAVTLSTGGGARASEVEAVVAADGRAWPESEPRAGIRLRIRARGGVGAGVAVPLGACEVGARSGRRTRRSGACTRLRRGRGS